MMFASDMRPRSSSVWSLRVAALSVQLILVAAVLHRVALLQTPVMLDLFKVALAGAGLAILLAIFALYRIWREGGSGGGRATWGILVAACILAWPAALSAWYLQLPLINDVTTDTRQPPVFRALAETRRSATAPLTYPAAFAEPQLAAYPGVEPMLVRRSSTEAFELVREAVRRLRWTVVQEQPPDLRSGMPGTIEAVDRTLVLGFPDDIVIRVQGDRRSARIDMRSASRYGRHDFGQNARRLLKLAREVQARVAATVGAVVEPEARPSPPPAARPSVSARKRVRKRSPVRKAPRRKSRSPAAE
ncbi:MAG: DUF1499 domain-containing protein [Hyphomicrobiaceae bacterium]|nr:DUF1499 domain-containing protein [Hyphomicrobiaceae bacterium]